MAMDYSRNKNQFTPIPGKNMIQNHDGAFVFDVGPWKHLERFLILGTEGGTFYASEKDYTQENLDNLHACITLDGQKVVEAVVKVSVEGLGRNNEPCIYALAACAKLGNEETRKAANLALPLVVRIGTHLFHYARYIKSLGGWGTGQVRAISRWYENRSAQSLLNMVLKYQQRDGWSNYDLFRLCHPTPQTFQQGVVFSWVMKGRKVFKKDFNVCIKQTPPNEHTIGQHLDRYPELNPLIIFELLNDIASLYRVNSVSQILIQRLMKDFPFSILRGLTIPYLNEGEIDIQAFILELIKIAKLPHEAIPNELKKDPKIWETLLDNMKPEACLRNLGRMSALGLFEQKENLVKLRKILNDENNLKDHRIHPISVLLASCVYRTGHGMKGNLTWLVIEQVRNILNDCFYLALKVGEPTGKKILVAIDSSTSMISPGLNGLNRMDFNPRIASAAMALALVYAEDECDVIAFTQGINCGPMNYKKTTTLDEAVQQISRFPCGGTDCSLPIQYALEKKKNYDAIIIFTDSETNNVYSYHPIEYLKTYRKQRGTNTKFIVAATTATRNSIGDGSDPGVLDIVGFSADVPLVIQNFLKL